MPDLGAPLTTAADVAEPAGLWRWLTGVGATIAGWALLRSVRHGEELRAFQHVVSKVIPELQQDIRDLRVEIRELRNHLMGGKT